MDVSLDEATKRIKAGEVGILPTDTVMGLVCSATDQSAVNRLYSLKARERKPGTLIGADIDQFVSLGIKARYLRAVEGYWPNAISVVVPCPDADFTYLHQGKGTLAVRLPRNEKIHALLRKTGPLLTTSANMPGKPPATTLTRISHFQLAPDRTCMAANSRSALDVAIATPPSVQEFSLIQEHSGINLKVRNSCLTEAKEYFGESVDFYVKPIPGLVQKPSTIIRIVDDSVEVLREGVVKINKETGEIQ
ncbi:hypothetical protein BH23PAT2_BH23PAT2_04760 [soil metagenome]